MSSLFSQMLPTDQVVEEKPHLQEEKQIEIATYSQMEFIPDPRTISLQTQDLREKAILFHRMWRLSPLYRQNELGSQLMWWIGFNIDTNELVMSFGHVGGKIRFETTRVETNQSGRNIHEQSMLEARQRYQIKYRNEHYRQPGEAPKIYNKPMLAGRLEFVDGTRHTENPQLRTRLRFPIYVQPKLDGARCLSRLEGGNIIFRSRGDVRWNHLIDEFGEQISLFLSYIPWQCELDGEVYLHGKRFTEFISILKNMRVKHHLLGELKYYIYDFHPTEPIPMEHRIAALYSAKAAYDRDNNPSNRFEILATYSASSIQDVIHHHKYFRSLGFEGTIIRKIAGPNPTETHLREALYKPNRGLNIIKLKDVEDAEFPIVGVCDAEGTETGAALVFIEVKFPDKTGQIITSNIRMRPSYPFEERRLWLTNPSLVIGKLATVEFDSVSEYGVPRNPVMKSLRDYE